MPFKANLPRAGLIELGRIAVDLPDELEKRLRLKTIERFGGRKGDLDSEEVPGEQEAPLIVGDQALSHSVSALVP